MKKFFKSLCCLIILFSASLILFACNEKPIKTLQTPVFVGIVNNGELTDDEIDENQERPFTSTQLLLVTEKNQYASGYRFYITDNENYNSISNYVSYETSGRDKNYLDVTDIFKDKKPYYFRVQYLGKDNYLNSAVSDYKEYIPTKEQISAPYVQLVGTSLCWNQVINSEKYEVYETVLDAQNTVVRESTKIGETDSGTYNFDISERFSETNAPYYKYQYNVKGIANKFYLNSNLSNKIEYIKSIKLNTPNGLVIKKENDSFILNWNKVDYATKYEIKQNNIVIGESDEESFNITSSLTNYAGYTFSIKAIESEALSYSQGDYCLDYLYNYTTKLNKTSNIEVLTDGEYIEISFDDVINDEYAKAENGFTLEIYYENNKVYSNETVQKENEEDSRLTIRLKYTEFLGELDSDKNITIKIKTNKVGEYIFESDVAEFNYTILKPITE